MACVYFSLFNGIVQKLAFMSAHMHVSSLPYRSHSINSFFTFSIAISVCIVMCIYLEVRSFVSLISISTK